MYQIIMYRNIIQTICLAILLVLPPTAHASDDVRTVTGTYTFYGEPHHSVNDCKRLALEGARLEALKQFGTMMQQNTLTAETERDGEAATRFLNLTSTEVRGEWLGDIDAPRYDAPSFDSDGNIIVTCHVKGRARAITNESVRFAAKVLKGCSLPECADTHFADGQDMRLLFRAPTDGYVAVFLSEENGNVCRLLPYSASTDDLLKVRKNREYVFFDPSMADHSDPTPVDELVMHADRTEEFNTLVVIFSPNPFAMPPTQFTDDLTPRSLTNEEFQKWFIASKMHDTKMGQQSFNLVISPAEKRTETIRH